MAATCVALPASDAPGSVYYRQRILKSTTGWAEKLQIKCSPEVRVADTTYGYGGSPRYRRYHTANSPPPTKPLPASRVCKAPPLSLSHSWLNVLTDIHAGTFMTLTLPESILRYCTSEPYQPTNSFLCRPPIRVNGLTKESRCWSPDSYGQSHSLLQHMGACRQTMTATSCC